MAYVNHKHVYTQTITTLIPLIFVEKINQIWFVCLFFLEMFPTFLLRFMAKFDFQLIMTGEKNNEFITQNSYFLIINTNLI